GDLRGLRLLPRLRLPGAGAVAAVVDAVPAAAAGGDHRGRAPRRRAGARDAADDPAEARHAPAVAGGEADRPGALPVRGDGGVPGGVAAVRGPVRLRQLRGRDRPGRGGPRRHRRHDAGRGPRGAGPRLRRGRARPGAHRHALRAVHRGVHERRGRCPGDALDADLHATLGRVPARGALPAHDAAERLRLAGGRPRVGGGADTGVRRAVRGGVGRAVRAQGLLVARRAHRLATVLLAAVTAGGLLAAHAQSIAYTVQVVALSDREAALLVQTDLLRQGYPAYVVRSTSQQGDVFRVRVGAFANRQAAALYAEAMPPVSGGQPVPALAEGIPPGITPCPPPLLPPPAARADALVYPWEDGFALRLPSGTGPAEYVLVSGSQVERHTAYLLGEREGARLWVRETSLYPPTWREETEAVNEGFRTSLVRLLAERLGVSVAEVEAAAFRPDPEEAPRLVVVELEAPEEPDGVRLLGLGLPASGMGEHGPLEYLGIDPEELPLPPA